MTDERLDEQLALGWRGLSPPEGLKQRVRARLAAPLTGWPALRASGGYGMGVGALLLGLGFGIGYSARAPLQGELPENGAIETLVTADDSVSAERSAPSLSAARSSQAAALESAPVTEEVPSPRPRARRGLRASRKGGQAADDTGELALIERAERALRARNPEVALALSRELAERHPRSKFQEERGAILLMARCQSGETDTDVERERFAAQYPDSVYGDRVASECGTN